MAYVTLNEAASFLGVSKATLRNWDRSGKLRAIRHPINEYRVYALSALEAIHDRLPFVDEIGTANQATPGMDVRATRTFVARLHNILRDHDSHSNIIERFDELTKLLFLKLVSEADSTTDQSLERQSQEDNKAYASRIRASYAEAAKKHSRIVPTAFATLRTSDSANCECATALAQLSFKKADLDVQGLAY